ncbi:uncharacterized protein LOC129596287 [Paramacrobiotus metropolitanus]|uniref:uncharacterized protein LOC129596287 n=1 Tax=Paramacrobiotus metropolitanus TaxID=2943436 RepID=UPI002445AB6E|nr:uncharacterized protein LOC129596287 [Paramacrobiotus metropolitanus]
MGKFRRSFHNFLNKDREWAYQEIITEAVVVLWFAAQLSVKFGSRIFAEWQTSRTDPAISTQLDRFLGWIGLEMTGCVWNDVVSFWKAPDEIAVIQSVATLFTSPTVGTMGYVGAFVTVCTTAILTISVAGSLYVYRNWRYPRFRQHLRSCNKITRLFGYGKDDNGDYTVGLAYETVSCGLLVIAATGVQLCCAAVVWFLLCALPVVLVTGAVMAVVINIYGLIALFPCCVISVCFLAVYCSGRIYGLWMQETYFMRIHRKIKKTFGVDMLVVEKYSDNMIESTPEKCFPSAKITPAAKKSMPSFESVFLKGFLFYAVTAGIVSNTGPIWEGFPIIRYGMNSLGSHWSSGSAASSASPASSKTYWTESNRTTRCRTYGTNLGARIAMLSFWVDLASDELKSADTYNAPIIISFNPGYPSIVSGSFVLWNGLVLAAGCLPLLLLVLAEALTILLGISYIVWRILESSWDACRNRKDAKIQRKLPFSHCQPIINFLMDIADKYGSEDAGDGAAYDFDVNKKPFTDTIVRCTSNDRCSSSQPAFCVCSTWAYTVYCIVTMVQALLGWMLLPFPVLVFALPERLQLPGILLFFSALAVYKYRQFIPSALKDFSTCFRNRDKRTKRCPG